MTATTRAGHRIDNDYVRGGLRAQAEGRCYKCGCVRPADALNGEGVIHHRESTRCIDTKACRRAQRKAAR